MDSEKLSQEYWEQVPQSELPQFATNEKTAGEVEKLGSFLKKTDNILDVGCGWGRITCALAMKGYNVTGMDLSENLVEYGREYANKAGLRIQFHIGSVLNLPYDNESFDRIICLWGVFSHLLTPKDQVNALNEMYRVLKRNGLSFIETSNGESKRYKHIVATRGYGHEGRVWDFQFKESSPPNVLYIHDRRTMTSISRKSEFEGFRVKFQNINHKRRLVAYLFKMKNGSSYEF